MTIPPSIASKMPDPPPVRFNINHRPCLPAVWFPFIVSSKESFRVQVKRVLQDNFRAWRLAEALNKDPDAFPQWVTFLANEVLIDWDGIVQHTGEGLCKEDLTCEGCTKVEPTPTVKEDFILKWNEFRVWLWAVAVDEGGFRGNSRGASASPGGGAPSIE